MKPSTSNRNLWIIIGILLINAIGMTLVFPLMPFVLEPYLPEAQIVIGLNALVTIYAVATFLAAPAFGALSDRYGRKIILIVSLLGSAVGYVMFGIGGALWVFALSRLIDGLTAGNASTLFSYIADSTQPEERTKWFGYAGAAMGLGFIIGPAIGGLLGTASLALPFYVTAGIITLSILLTWFFLPESLAPAQRTATFSARSLNPFAHFKDIFAMKEVAPLLILGGFFYIGLSIYQFNLALYVKDVFAWGPGFIGGVMALVGVCDILSRAVLLPLMLKRLRSRTVGIIGLSGLVLGFSLIVLSAFVTTMAVILAAVACITLGEGLFDPAYNGRLSASVDESKQGALQGANQSLQAGYRVIIPLAAAAIYVYSPSAVFAIAALIMAGALVMFLRLAEHGQSRSASVEMPLHVEAAEAALP